MELNEISSRVLAAGFKVHTAIGPGVLESVYQTCLHHELRKGRSACGSTSLTYRFNMMAWIWNLDIALICLVEDTVIVELKCVDALLPIHKAQLLTYLKLANKPLGLLLNFNVVHLREGIKRVLNNRLPTSALAASG